MTFSLEVRDAYFAECPSLRDVGTITLPDRRPELETLGCPECTTPLELVAVSTTPTGLPLLLVRCRGCEEDDGRRA